MYLVLTTLVCVNQVTATTTPCPRFITGVSSNCGICFVINFENKAYVLVASGLSNKCLRVVSYVELLPAGGTSISRPAHLSIVSVFCWQDAALRR